MAYLQGLKCHLLLPLSSCKRPLGSSGSVSRVLSWAIIYLGYTSPCTSSAQPERTEGRPYRVPIRTCSRWGLPSRAVTGTLVRSYRTVSAFLLRGRGVFFSVALSVESPRPAVSWHLALGSPDFPHICMRDRLTHSNMLFYQNKWRPLRKRVGLLWACVR